jgi:hypothetical protein
LPGAYVRKLIVSPGGGGSGASLFVGVDGSGVWRRPVSDLVSVHELAGNDLPRDFSLAQNYPNPFNPLTNVDFQLPISSHVNLRIFDLLGREVAVLADEVRKAGSYHVSWDAAKMPSGMYVYRLTAGNFVSVRKMILTK